MSMKSLFERIKQLEEENAHLRKELQALEERLREISTELTKRFTEAGKLIP